MLSPCTQLSSLDMEIDEILVQHGRQLAQYRRVLSIQESSSAGTPDPVGSPKSSETPARQRSAHYCALAKETVLSVCGLLTRWLLLQNASTSSPVASWESSWLKGDLTEGRVRCQSACGNVSRSICWLVPTGQKANICFAETKHFHLKTFAVETIIW